VIGELPELMANNIFVKMIFLEKPMKLAEMQHTTC
jgi:hypothetical protein